MPRKKHHGICPLCGREALLTRDHVPPEGVFLPPKPDNLITVRTCKACNEGTKLDDEYFRLCLTPGPNASQEQWELWNEKIYGSTLKRSPKLRSRLVQLMDAVREHHKTSPLEFIDGTPLTNEEIEQTLPLEKPRIDHVVEKIVRCLYYHFADAVLPMEIKVNISLVALKDHIDQLAKPCGIIGNHREFVFWYNGLKEVSGSTWLLLFYESQLFKAELYEAA